MATFDLYGLQNPTLEAARDAIEGALGRKMDAHESGYHAGAYYRIGLPGSEHFILQSNYDEFEGEWTEPAFKDYAYLLYINETHRSLELGAALSGVTHLLKRQEL